VSASTFGYWLDGGSATRSVTVDIR
jgi:hypothetical protein